jgi:hypothetical protein
MGEGSPIAGETFAAASSEGGATAIGVGTSVVVPLLVALAEVQAAAARRRLERAVERGEPVFVSDLVLAESYHALQHHYGLPKSEARSILHRFATSGTLAEVRLEIPLLQTRRPFAYQALAEKAWNFNRLGLSAVATAKSLGVSDKAVLKAIEWFKRRRDPGVG